MPACTWHSPAQTCMFCPPGDPPDVRAEELVGQEQHLALGRDGLDDLDRVGGRAADVGLGLHRGRGVDVADHDGVGVLGLPVPQLLGGDRVGQRAAGVRVGDQHGLVRGQDLGGLGHEVDPAEHDRRRLGGGGDAGQGQRVPGVVGDVLDLRQLVVVRQQHRVPPAGQLADLGEPSRVGPGRGVGNGGEGHRGLPSLFRPTCFRLGVVNTLDANRVGHARDTSA